MCVHFALITSLASASFAADSSAPKTPKMKTIYANVQAQPTAKDA